MNHFKRSKVRLVKVKGHMGQGQIRVPNKGRWAHNNVKLLHYNWCNGLIETMKFNYPRALATVNICGEMTGKGLQFAVGYIIDLMSHTPYGVVAKAVGPSGWKIPLNLVQRSSGHLSF